jgi:hypothetical protein
MTAQRHSKTGGRLEGPGVEQYPFDPLLQPEGVEGLDRLRCISNRRYAATLYEIYMHAERNEVELQREKHFLVQAAEKKERVRERLRELARRALAGTLGAEAQELALCIVADSVGNVRNEDRALAEFGRVLAELGAI